MIHCVEMSLFTAIILTMGCLSLATFNCQGHGPDRVAYISKLCETNDIVLLQEHWLPDEQISSFESKIDGICCHGVSGMASNELLIGRPYGGCAILWKRALLAEITPGETKV